MKNQIRKISLGHGHPDQMMHYQVGKTFKLNNDNYTISDIILDRELLSIGKISYNIFIINDVEKILWKTIVDVPTVVEYNIGFE